MFIGYPNSLFGHWKKRKKNQKRKKNLMETKPHKTLILKLIECGGGVGDDSYTYTHTHRPHAICSIPFPWRVTMDASMRIFVCILHALGTWNLKLYLCMCALDVCNICENLFQHIFFLLVSLLRFIVLESMLLCFHLFHVFESISLFFTLIFFCHFSWWFPIIKSSIILNPIIMVRSNIGSNVEIKSKKKFWINVVQWHRVLSYGSPFSREKWMMEISNKQLQTTAATIL